MAEASDCFLRMGEIPSLLSLCVEAIRNELVRGDDILPYVYELPSHLFDSLLTRLPPVALQKLQDHMPFVKLDDIEPGGGGFKNRRKRKRFLNFETAWRELYYSRWSGPVKQTQPVKLMVEQDVENDDLMIDWQMKYWESHLQNCLDAAAEIAFLPSFNGCLGEIEIPDSVIKFIGCDGYLSTSTNECSKLSFHCRQFGLYARCLRLENVLCVAEISHLLKNCKLQSLAVKWIKSKEQVGALCKLLSQNRGTLTSVEFMHCKLSSDFVNAVCCSLSMKNLLTHGIQHFSIKTSSFSEYNSVSFPAELTSFLSSGRSLYSLSFYESHLQPSFARMVFDTLLEASSTIAVLDLSENNISGWLSHFKWRPSSCSQRSLKICKSLQSLRKLNLRNTNLHGDDAECLQNALVHMPNLEIIDLSGNPIGDGGIKNLIPYFVEISKRSTPFATLKLENCRLSGHGVSQLLEVLSAFEKPLNTLSIGENHLGSKVGALLGKFMCMGIQALYIEDIGLGSSGFLEAQEQIVVGSKLLYINISNNRGGIETAKFLSKLCLCSPEIVAVNAGYNFMPIESLSIICSGLRELKGKLEHIDLTGNPLLGQPADASLLAELQNNGKPIIVFNPSLAPCIPYDDEP